MPVYEMRRSQGFPLDEEAMNVLGKEGYRLVGVVRTATVGDGKYVYPSEEFWYYFIRKRGFAWAREKVLRDGITLPSRVQRVKRLCRSVGVVSERLRGLAAKKRRRHYDS